MVPNRINDIERVKESFNIWFEEICTLVCIF